MSTSFDENESLAYMGTVVAQIKSEYAYLMTHIDQLRVAISYETHTTGDVYVLPVPTQSDIGSHYIDYTQVERLTGNQAVERSLAHFGQHILKVDQAGVMANRLPGVLFVNQADESDILSRIRRINEIKTSLMQLVRSVGETTWLQFMAMTTAVPYALRKSIGRHIHAYPAGSVLKVGYSLSTRNSYSKPAIRDEWIDKLERARDNITTMKNHSVDEWQAIYDKEIATLNALPPKTYLRTIRPLRKSPVYNITYADSRHGTQIAHSPLILINHDLKEVGYRPFNFKKPVAAHKKLDSPAILPRWHLYEFNTSTTEADTFSIGD